MCMLFIFTNPNPNKDEYSLVVASIRDEFLLRPSRQCHFWECNPQIVGGMDYEKGKEGGTWLAMNTSGKVAAILNVLKPLDQTIEKRKPRGFLTVNYLLNDLDGYTYLKKIAMQSHNFDGFILVAIDIKQPNNQALVSYFTNLDEKLEPHILDSGIYVFGNSLPDEPWKKVYKSKPTFAKILIKNRKINNKQNLVKQLLTMMSQDIQYFPDDQLLLDGNGLNEQHLRELSSVCVKMPNVLFGSRTQSIILVDVKGNVDYVERTMQEPIDELNVNNWIHTTLRFKLQCSDSLPVSRL